MANLSPTRILSKSWRARIALGFSESFDHPSFQ